MSRKLLLHPCEGEFARQYLRRQIAPPIRLAFALEKEDAPELPRIGENQSLLALEQNQMVVLARDEVCGLNKELPRHAEMNSEPYAARESESHLLAVRRGGDELRARNCFHQLTWIASAENAF